MKIKQSIFIENLEKSLLADRVKIKDLSVLSLEDLQKRPHPKSWNILECVYHLNLYGEFYIPQFKEKIKKGKPIKNDIYKSGWLGNYFANIMKPNKGKIANKMPAPSDKNPIGLPLEKDVFEIRLQQIELMINILKTAKEVDIKKSRCSITISKWITLQLGDTLHFIINHENRHTLQAVNIMHDISIKKHEKSI